MNKGLFEFYKNRCGVLYNMPSYRFNSKAVINGDTLFYVNGTTGNDDNDGLTVATALRTVQKAVSKSAVGGIIVISAGTYIFNDKWDVNFGKQNKLHFIGDMCKTIFEINNVNSTSSLEDFSFYYITITKTNDQDSWDNRQFYYPSNGYGTTTKMRYYNCVFKPPSNISTFGSFFYFTNSESVDKNDVLFENCIFLKRSNGINREYFGGRPILKNIIFEESQFTESWALNGDFKHITDATIDPETFKITSDGWKNIGVLDNGSPTDLGIYGGTYNKTDNSNFIKIKNLIYAILNDSITIFLNKSDMINYTSSVSHIKTSKNNIIYTPTNTSDVSKSTIYKSDTKFQKFINNNSSHKFLIEYNSQYYKYQDSSFSTVDISSISVDAINTNGFSDIDSIPEDKFSIFTQSEFDIYYIKETTESISTQVDNFNFIDYLNNQESFTIITLTNDESETKSAIIETDKYFNQLEGCKIAMYAKENKPVNLYANAVVDSPILYQISYDNSNWYGVNSESELTSGEYMTKEQLEALTPDKISTWLGDHKLYESDLFIKCNIGKKNSYSNSSVKNITIEFLENQALSIISPNITPDSFHNEEVNLTATINDLEGEEIEYKISIKKAGESKFNIFKDWKTIKNNSSISQTFTGNDFNIGENILRLEARDKRGLISKYEKTVTFSNKKPTALFTHDNFGLDATITDPESDKFTVQIEINNEVVFPYKTSIDEYFTSPYKFKYEWNTENFILNKKYSVKFKIKDSYGSETVNEFPIVGEYKNILFYDERQNLYTTDKGRVLRYMNLGLIEIPGESDIRKFILKNNCNSAINNIELKAGLESPDINVQLSLDSELSDATNILRIPENMNHGDTKEVYLRLNITGGRGEENKEFPVLATAKIVKS